MRTAFSPIARQSGDWRSRGRASAVPLRTCRLDSTLFLLGTGAAKADYEAGCQPDVVLVGAEERCAVVVGIENADGKVRSQIKVDATAGFHRKSQVCVGQAAWAADGIVDVRAANQEFSERAGAPLIAFAVEYARAEVVSVESDIHAVVRRDVVAGVRDDLQPRLGVPREGADDAFGVRGGAAIIQARVGEAAKQFGHGRPWRHGNGALR